MFKELLYPSSVKVSLSKRPFVYRKWVKNRIEFQPKKKNSSIIEGKNKG